MKGWFNLPVGAKTASLKATVDIGLITFTTTLYTLYVRISLEKLNKEHGNVTLIETVKHITGQNG